MIVEVLDRAIIHYMWMFVDVLDRAFIHYVWVLVIVLDRAIIHYVWTFVDVLAIIHYTMMIEADIVSTSRCYRPNLYIKIVFINHS